MRKTGCFITTAVISIIVGFVFLIRSCLSSYDEYALEGNARIFRQSSTSIITYIKDHYDVSSYSQEGGVTSIGGSHYYYLETRDALSLTLLKNSKLEGEDSHIPKIIGNSANILWIFDEQLKAFDPFTHTIVCTEEKLTQLNPELRNYLPSEPQYYTFDYTNNCLKIFTRNALRYAIDEKFKATPFEEDTEKESPAVTQLKAWIKQYETNLNSEANHINHFLRRDTLWEMQKRVNILEEEYNEQKEFREQFNKIQDEQFSSMDGLIINASVHDSTVYGLIPRKEMDPTNTSFNVRQYFSAEEQRFLCKAVIKEIRKSQGLYSWMSIGRWTTLSSSQYFLKGNFLLNKHTLQPIILQNPASWLIISVKEIGQNSPLMLHRVEPNGKTIWSKELPITTFNNLLYIPDKAVIFCSKPASNDDKQSDIFLTIDLQTGNHVITDLK